MHASQAPEALDERFAIPGLARFEAGAGGLTRLSISTRHADAHIYLHGAHVTHHRPAGQPSLLFLSERSRFAPGAAIRGGVPIVFPWFGPRAGVPDHGFARISEWAVQSVERAGDGVAVALALEASPATRALWPHEFRITCCVTVGAALDLTAEVENRSDAPFTFEAAFHTYLRVGDVGQTSLAGLEGADYIDKTDGMKRKTLAPGPFRLDAETDRVFPGARGSCVVSDAVLGRRVVVDKRASATTVVWNPWNDKAAHMADLGGVEWRHMLCVETANAMDDAVTLAPGARHAMGATIRATPA